MKAVQQVIVSNGVPYLQMTLIGLHSMSGRKNEVTKERMGTESKISGKKDNGELFIHRVSFINIILPNMYFMNMQSQRTFQWRMEELNYRICSTYQKE